MPSRLILVARCSACDGVTLPANTLRWDCQGCGGKNTRGHVDVRDAPPPRTALNAPIMVDRFYEGARATDGTDIGSRQKHREYMRQNNLTTVDDYRNEWAAAAKEREAIRTGTHDKAARREAVARALYERSKRGTR